MKDERLKEIAKAMSEVVNQVIPELTQKILDASMEFGEKHKNDPVSKYPVSTMMLSLVGTLVIRMVPPMAAALEKSETETLLILFANISKKFPPLKK